MFGDSALISYGLYDNFSYSPLSNCSCVNCVACSFMVIPVSKIFEPNGVNLNE